MIRRCVLVVAGETASGKSDFAVDLAQRYDAEIVGADSRQIYRGMEIGTAAPEAALLERVPHHLIGFLDPRERYSAARFVADARTRIDEIHARGKRVIVVGGTGFYLRALCEDIALGPEVDPAARARMHREAALHDGEFLYGWLRCRDPRRAAELSPGDRYRVIRALETSLASPSESSSSEPAARSIPAVAHYRFCKIWHRREPLVLAERIERRVASMLERGFLAEAQRIGENAVAADAVGYPHAFAYLRGQLSESELRMHLVRATRRYAKRQATWLRGEPHLRVIAAEQDPNAAVAMMLEDYDDWRGESVSRSA